MSNGELSGATLAQLKATAKEVVDGANNRTSGGLPVVFLPEGLTKCRFYLDPEQKFDREVYRYNVGGTYLPWMGDDSPVEKLVKQLEETGYGNAWKLKARQHFISYACLTHVEKETKYTKLGEPCILIYDYRVRNEIYRRLNEWDEEVLKCMFNPDLEYNMWMISYHGGKGGNASVSADFSKAKVPNLSATALPLHEVWVAENAKPDEAGLQKACLFLKSEIQRHSNLKDPTSNAQPTVEQEMKDQMAKFAAAPPVVPVVPIQVPVAVQALPAAPVAPIQVVAVQAKPCPHSDKGMVFGKHTVSSECLLCDFESECIAATSK